MISFVVSESNINVSTVCDARTLQEEIAGRDIKIASGTSRRSEPAETSRCIPKSTGRLPAARAHRSREVGRHSYDAEISI
jgi:hypothetical protein